VPRLKDVVDDHLGGLFGSRTESSTDEDWDVLETGRLPPDRPRSPRYERVSSIRKSLLSCLPVAVFQQAGMFREMTSTSSR
jgi:hypothetical protein